MPSIIGADLSGRTAWAGVPSAVYLLGVAASSLILGYVMDRVGRRKALATGFAVGAFGAAIAAWAIVSRHFPGFLLGQALMGPGSAAAGLSRFVAAEVHPPQERGRAIATVVVGGTAGTLIWPLLSVSAGPRLARLNVSDLLWPFGFSSLLLLLASAFLTIFLRPDPSEMSQCACPAGSPRCQTDGSQCGVARDILRRPGAIVAMASMVLGHAVMVMVMVITSLHMRITITR